ncbi:MAG TPA: helix-turn-helix domain-containing protein, partial [Gallionellaceae bacterium]|nr:helix-turn-helix domain-containing protein [Gallionellaceae bacterium]
MEQQQENTQPGAAGYGLDVGAILREARESAGMSVEEVAGRIKFAPRQIVALESGDYAQLPEMAFIRGFVRSYARMLELDDKALLSALPGAPAPVAVQVGSA